MVYKFTLALYDPSKGKHKQLTWDCNFSNAQSVYNIALKVMEKKLINFSNSKIVVVNIDKEIDFIKQ